MKIAVHCKAFEKEKVPVIQEIFNELRANRVHIQISKLFKNYLEREKLNFPYDSVFQTPHQLKDTSVVLSVGGDGTFLETITLVREVDVPILGINIGRLGFLATLSADRISEGLQMVFDKKYTIDERSMLRLESNTQIFGSANFALNELSITKRDSASMIIVHTYLDEEYMNSYWADGLIVATPTGSTGYSLSVGGPVVVPHSSNFVIAPISPHNLNIRPLVVPDNCKIRFEIEGRSKNFLVSLDSRSLTVDASIQLAVKKCEFSAKLIRLEGEKFLNTLRKKVNWGMDSRN
ncbi:MAG: NAD kinase [Bacteroidetes bacterium]|nr:MAG: NAD kinase [Bacteroidota bacterium]